MNKYYQKPEAELDLHQMTRAEAQTEVCALLEEAEEREYKKIRIITGKGLHSPDGVGVLHGYVREMLDSRGIKYMAAKYNEGGEGAIDVLL